MVALELSCRKNGTLRLLHSDALTVPTGSPREPFQWSVNVNGRLKLGLVPDRVFALESADGKRSFYFLEADRSTMPVMRQGLSQSSFHRKLIAYEATWTQGIHRSRFDFHRFRVLTVTTSSERVQSLVEVCRQLERGRGLFLFTHAAALAESGDLLTLLFQSGRDGLFETLAGD